MLEFTEDPQIDDCKDQEDLGIYVLIRVLVEPDDSIEISFNTPLFDQKFRFYWKKDLAEQKADLLTIFQAISDEMINQPYQLDPELHFDADLNGKSIRVYHPNHATTHAARQFMYANEYMDLIQKTGSDKWREVIAQLTVEERAIAFLAAFCLRIGRRNEASERTGSKDPLRSAQLFDSIALQLGFEPKLVRNIAFSMYCKVPMQSETTRYDGFEGTAGSELPLDKAKLMQLIMYIVHRTDLVRCWGFKGDEKYTSIKGPLSKRLSLLLGNEQSAATIEHAEQSADRMLVYACRSCVATGNKVKLQQLGFNYPRYNKKLTAACTVDVNFCFKQLEQVIKP